MIELGPAEGDFPHSAAESAGGFVWWYADLFDGHGNGVVCIWSFGLPFLPGYAASEKAGAAVLPRERPSVTVSVYRDGREAFYLFTELSPEECEWAQDTWRFGGFEAQLNREGRLKLTMDLPIPGSADRFEAELLLEGCLRQSGDEARDPAHSWEPVLLGKVEGVFKGRAGAREFSLTGRGYHDRNAGVSGMHRLGIQHWRWFRISREDRDLVLYLLDPEVSGGDARNLAFEVHQDGRLEMLEVTSVRHERRGWSWVGPRWPRRTEVEFACGQRLVVDHVALVDSSPFYQRSLVKETGRSGGFGVAELVIPGKIDQDLQRWLVRMRVHRQTGKNSIWLPLFSGPRSGRWSRLIAHWKGTRPLEERR